MDIKFILPDSTFATFAPAEPCPFLIILVWILRFIFPIRLDETKPWQDDH